MVMPTCTGKFFNQILQKQQQNLTQMYVELTRTLFIEQLFNGCSKKSSD